MFEGFETRDIDSGATTIHCRIGGSGKPLLLLHGYPQTGAMWHKLAPRLAESFTVIVPDLRGYGASGKPPSDPEHLTYSKRETAKDMVMVMRTLGYDRFQIAGHDRGGRVTHRLALDHAGQVERAAVLDIVPTYRLFKDTDQEFATGYYHWFFLIQPNGLPEKMIGDDPSYYLRSKLNHWGKDFSAFTPEALAEYEAAFSNPETIHASCEDYRAGASIDLRHDEADNGKKIACPLLVLWGAKGLMQLKYDVLETWRERAEDVRGKALPCGHFLPEEAPEETLAAFLEFFEP